MSNAPQISVIIPVYNRSREAIACLESLERQTHSSFEVIMVNDGSTDDVALQVQKRHWRFSFHLINRTKNSGSPVAPRNEGFRHARGSFIFFLDADIVLVPSALEELVRALEMYPEASFAYSAHYFGWKLFSGRPFDIQALRACNYIHTSALIRRESFPGFDGALRRFQDWDLWLTIVERGGVGVWVSKPLFRVEPGGTISTWLPSFVYRIPWEKIGWMPKEIKKYRDAEKIIREKHHL